MDSRGLIPEPELCPNCVRPMRWARHVSDHSGMIPVQIYECKSCKVVLVAASVRPTPDRHVH
jgi:hypothetical protein